MNKSNKYLNRFILASAILVLPGLSSTSWGLSQAASHAKCGMIDEKGILANTKYLSVAPTDLDKISLITTSGKKDLQEEYPERGRFNTYEQTKFNISSVEGRAKLASHVQSLLAYGQVQKKAKQDLKDLKKSVSHEELKLLKKAIENKEALVQTPNAKKYLELKRVSETEPSIGGDIEIGLNELLVLIDQMDSSSNTLECQNRIKSLIAEISNAINNNFSAPIVSRINIQDHFMTGWDSHINRPGDKPGPMATNILVRNGQDASTVNPPDSPLWVNKKIEEQNTRLGFGRTSQAEVIDVSNEVLEYSEPKEGYGTRPGMKVTTQDKKKVYKVRIKVEASTGPFLSRIGNALGFSTYAVDHAKQITMKMNLDFFTEYNSRSQFGAEVVLPRGKDTKSVEEKRQPHWNPFDVILGAKLKNGVTVSKEVLMKNLFTGTMPIKENEFTKAFENEKNYSKAYADTIDTFTIGPVSLEVIDKKKESSVGAWGWNGLGHADLREARGFTMLAAWLSLHDIRKENTRLMILTNSEGKKELQLRVSDWGSGLGLAEGHLLGFKNERPNQMPNEFVKVVIDQKDKDPKDQSKKVLITTFKPNQPSLAADRMNYDDARWMARQIARLTEKQIADALSVSGYPEADQRVYKFKLLTRRNQMVKELGLEAEGIRLLATEDERSLPSIKIQVVEKGENDNPLLTMLTDKEFEAMFTEAFLATKLDQTEKLNQIFRLMQVPETEDQAKAMKFTAERSNNPKIEELKLKYASVVALFLQVGFKAGSDHFTKAVRLYMGQPPGHRAIIFERLPDVVKTAIEKLSAQVRQNAQERLANQQQLEK